MARTTSVPRPAKPVKKAPVKKTIKKVAKAAPKAVVPASPVPVVAPAAKKVAKRTKTIINVVAVSFTFSITSNQQIQKNVIIYFSIFVFLGS